MWSRCALCERLANGVWMLDAGRNQLVWSFLLPRRGAAAAEFVSRTVRFCRRHVAVIKGFDPHFVKRHGDRELLLPDWWDEPARSVQVNYLRRLIVDRQCDPDVAVRVEAVDADLKRGEVCEWIEVLKYSLRRSVPELGGCDATLAPVDSGAQGLPSGCGRGGAADGLSLASHNRLPLVGGAARPGWLRPRR